MDEIEWKREGEFIHEVFIVVKNGLRETIKVFHFDRDFFLNCNRGLFFDGFMLSDKAQMEPDIRHILSHISLLKL